ncbi:MAG: PLDc N-terminal domain-containing protein [Acidimicrobiia bacterium]|nr:PLDc N-terminal domain-containing protein [Acidimicrobiia bacterium]
MTIAAEFGSGQFLWSLLWFFLFVMWMYLLITIFIDIFRSQDMSGWAKAIWAVFILFLPFLGILIYLIVRGGGMQDRQMAEAKDRDAAMQLYIRGAAGASSDADELTKIAELHNSGALDDAEYAAAKAKILG